MHIIYLTMDIEYVDIFSCENLSSIRLLIRTSFIGQFAHPVGKEEDRGIVILASWDYLSIRVLESLVQHPNNLYIHFLYIFFLHC